MQKFKSKGIVPYGIFFLLLSTLLLSSCGDPVGGLGKSPIFLSVQPVDPYGVMCDVYPLSRDDTNVEIKSIYKDPTNYTGTNFADVLLTEYRVTYFRSDNNPNVPEPFMFTLPNNVVSAGGTLNLGFIIVKSTAKLESPLQELAFGGGEGEIYFSALVEFFGEDLAGNAVSAEIVIPIWASDY